MSWLWSCCCRRHHHINRSSGKAREPGDHHVTRPDHSQRLLGKRDSIDLPLPLIHSTLPPLPSWRMHCHLALSSQLRAYINTNPPKKGKIFPVFLLWIKFQQTWLRIRHASQIKVCLGDRGAGGGAGPKSTPAFPLSTCKSGLWKAHTPGLKCFQKVTLYLDSLSPTSYWKWFQAWRS